MESSTHTCESNFLLKILPLDHFTTLMKNIASSVIQRIKFGGRWLLPTAFLPSASERLGKAGNNKQDIHEDCTTVNAVDRSRVSRNRCEGSIAITMAMRWCMRESRRRTVKRSLTRLNLTLSPNKSGIDTPSCNSPDVTSGSYLHLHNTFSLSNSLNNSPLSPLMSDAYSAPIPLSPQLTADYKLTPAACSIHPRCLLSLGTFNGRSLKDF